MIKNKYFTYINTTDKEQELVIEAIVDGERTVVNITLPPKKVAADITAEVRIKGGFDQNKKIEIKSVTASSIEVDASGTPKAVTKQVGARAPLSKDEIIKKSVLLDIETTGLRGPDIIHQIALYDPTEKKGLMFRPTPELIVTDKEGGEQGLSRRGRRLASRRYDVKSHKDGKFASTLIDMI